jgi:RimJ/RimL family protein N-acetyltransferase
MHIPIRTNSTESMDPFRSKRLLYRAWDPAKHDDLTDALLTDAAVYLPASKALPQPPGSQAMKEDFTKILQQFYLLAALCKVPTEAKKSNNDNGHNAEPEPIGQVAIKHIPGMFAHHRCGEMGIVIKSDHHGMGYGTEAIVWVLEWAFRTAGLHRVELTVYEWNPDARRLYERLGFQHEGRRRKAVWRDGRWWDEDRMGMLDSEWDGLRTEHVEAAD